MRKGDGEGYCRNVLGDYVRFCEIARGSLGELGSQIQDCERWGVVREGNLERLVALFGDATFFLEQLIKGLRAKRQEGTWDRGSGTKDSPASHEAGDADIPFTPPEHLP